MAEPVLRPEPDPSALTTQQILREVAMLREIVEARLDGMDKAIELSATFPTAIDSAIANIRDLFEEKFRGIATQFAERDARVEQTSKDRQVAIDAAFQAAKEAVGQQNNSSAQAIAKSEAATTKQIDAIGTLIQSTTKATDDKIDDLKARVTTSEGQSKGAGSLWGYIVGGVGLVFGIISVIAVLARQGSVP